jgi:hypothetical protein
MLFRPRGKERGGTEEGGEKERQGMRGRCEGNVSQETKGREGREE